MKVGCKIIVNWKDFGCYYEDVQEYVVVEYRHTLGIFKSDEDCTAGRLTPLCDLYYDGPDSVKNYIPNWGEYKTNQVQGWSDCL